MSKSNLPVAYMPEGDSMTPVVDEGLRELISLRAYELYLERGATDGEATTDWLRAEQEIMTALAEFSSPRKLRGKTLPERLFKRAPRKPAARKDGVKGKAA
jgi:hypothetical protein